nr:ribbon-helix-helix domain-containing protein [Candidatus Sigynarchaeota archaeon]
MGTEFVAVNLPRQLLERLDMAVQQVNGTGHLYNSSRAEAVRRAIERYIEYLDDLLRRYGKSPEPIDQKEPHKK